MNSLIWRTALVVAIFLSFNFLSIVALEAQKTIYFDDMESIESWAIGGQKGTNSRIRNVPGNSGQAIEIKYEFIFGNWVQMQKRINLNTEDSEQLEFYYKGGGDANILQVKLVDADGTTFGKNFSGITNTEGEWKLLSVPMAEMTYFWGGKDKELNRVEIEKFFLAIVRAEGGMGTIVIDELEFVK